MNKNIKKIVLTGLMTALVFLATSIIKIPSTHGYIHFGDGFIFLSVLILGPFYGAFASGVGSMLADLFSQFAQWALPTLIVKSLMALAMGLIIRQQTKKQAFISTGSVIVIWAGFFIMIKNALSRTIRFSIDNLAGTMEESAENVTKMASDVQLILTVAIIVFLVLVFVLSYWIKIKHSTTGFGPVTILGMLSGGACMVIGYYITEYVLYGNPVSPVFSVPMNLVQFITGIVITSLVAPTLLKVSPIINGELRR
jgi:uncharacterized membrane protein